MANILKPIDSIGGFSVSETSLIDENKNIKNVNTLQVKNSQFSDLSTIYYVLRGANTTILSLTSGSSTQIDLPANTINFITANIVAVSSTGGGHLSKKIESVVSVSPTGVVQELSSMETIIKDSVPEGESWSITPYDSGSAYKFSYSTVRSGISSIKWIAYVEVVSIIWT